MLRRRRSLDMETIAGELDGTCDGGHGVGWE